VLNRALKVIVADNGWGVLQARILDATDKELFDLNQMLTTCEGTLQDVGLGWVKLQPMSPPSSTDSHH